MIAGGSVVDGTGAPPRPADVAAADGRIEEVGEVKGEAHRTIDARGLLVTPGFVDIHTHYDGQATWDQYLTPSCWHGSPPQSWATAGSASRRSGPTPTSR